MVFREEKRTLLATMRKEIRPLEGLILKSPLNAAGIDTDPPDMLSDLHVEPVENEKAKPISVPNPTVEPFKACNAPCPDTP